MAIREYVFKVFLICSNVLLLCVGLTIFILGIKMLFALSMLSLLSIRELRTAVNFVLTIGVVIALCSLSGLLGGCSESRRLLLGHLIFLGIIVILEFSIGVTLMTVKRTVTEAVESADCTHMCAANFDAVILDYALPSVGLMMSVIFVEALMIYSSIRLYFFIRDRQNAALSAEPIVVMQNVPGAEAVFSPQPPAAIAYQFNRDYEVGSAYERPVLRSQSNIEDKPPDYHSITHYPPPYAYQMLHEAAGSSATPDPEQPQDTDESFNQV